MRRPGINSTRPLGSLDAIGRIVRESEATQPSNIIYDDTPIHVYMEHIKGALVARGRLAFRELFRPGMHKSALVGIFLAILELVRHHQAQAEQNELFTELWILPGSDQHAPLDLSQVDEYGHGVG